VGAFFCAVALLCFAGAGAARLLAPTANTERTRFDAIIVLGTSSDNDGNPTSWQLMRVAEAVREYERGVAPRLILTGGATNKGFVEAETMARTARSMGVPASAIVVEAQAMDTIQNARFSVRILQQHGWSSAEIVSGETHLQRAALLFSRLPLEWRVHAAPPLQPESLSHRIWQEFLETLKTVRYFLWTRWCEPWQP
jgi:uncharacterized SAM-binding protein YcdF (DUF218 family)